MRKYSRAFNKELQLRTSEIPEGEWDHITRYDYDFYEDHSWQLKRSYWGDAIYEDNEEINYLSNVIVSRSFIRKDMVAYVNKSRGLPYLTISQLYPIKYYKVDMESFYTMPIRRSRRIDKILSGNETDFITTIEDYFPKS